MLLVPGMQGEYVTKCDRENAEALERPGPPVR